MFKDLNAGQCSPLLKSLDSGNEIPAPYLQYLCGGALSNPSRAISLPQPNADTARDQQLLTRA